MSIREKITIQYFAKYFNTTHEKKEIYYITRDFQLNLIIDVNPNSTYLKDFIKPSIRKLCLF